LYSKIKNIIFKFINIVFKKNVFYSEYQELIITNYFLNRFNNADQYCIDIGASPPPNFFKVFLKYRFKIFCVDPIPLSNFNNINKRLNYFNGVIGNTNKPVKFFMGNKGYEVVSSTFDPIINRSFKKKNFFLTTVNQLTYNNFIKQHKIKNIFFLKIDI
jgi:hypothetical protein